MADERVCFAGDLSSVQVDRVISVQVPAKDSSSGEPFELGGVLLKVEHSRSFVTKKPTMYVLLGEPPESTGYVLDEHWKVVVR